MAQLTTSYQLIKTGDSQQFGYATGYLEIYAKYNSQSVTNNSTSVTYRLNLVVSGGYIGDYNGSKPVVITGTTDSQTTYIGNANYYSQELATYTETIPHNQDGTKSGTCSASVNFTGWGQTLTTGTGSFTLPTIPRASKLNSATMSIASNGNSITVTPNITKNVNTYYDCLVIKDGNTTLMTLDGVTHNTAKSLTSAQITSVFNAIGTATSKTFTCYIATYSSNAKTTLIGNSTSVNLVATLPTYTISATASVEDTVTAYNTYKGSGNQNKIYIANLSKPKFTLSSTSSTGSYYGRSVTYKSGGTAITSPYTDNSYTGQSYTITATDGRKTATATISPAMTHIPYFRPTLNVSVTRPTPTGNTVKVDISGSYYDGNGLTNLATATATLKYTEAGGTQQTTTITLTTSTSNHKTSFTGSTTLTSMNYQKSVTWSVTLSDRIVVTTTNSGTLPQGLPVWNAYRKNDENYFHVNGDAKVTSDLIVGSIKTKNMFSFERARIVATNKITYTTTSNSITQTNTGTYSRSSTRIYNVEIGKTYTLSCKFSNSSGSNVRMLVYDSTEANQLGATNNTTSASGTLTITFTSTDTAIRMRLYSNNSGTSVSTTVTFSEIQLEEGSIKTTFAPFQNLDGQEIYTTNEKQIGYWEDGRPLYQKVFTGTSSTSNSSTTVSPSTSFGNNVVVLYGGYIERGTGARFMIGAGMSSSDVKNYPYQNQSGGLLLYISDYNSNTYTYYLVVKYIKSTD